MKRGFGGFIRISKPLVLSGIRDHELYNTPEIFESLPRLGFPSCVTTNSETPASMMVHRNDQLTNTTKGL